MVRIDAVSPAAHAALISTVGVRRRSQRWITFDGLFSRYTLYQRDGVTRPKPP